jgi:hypothetical protein
MNKLYLKEPKNGHDDITCPLSVITFGTAHSRQTEYIVYSSIVDKTFAVKEDEVKLTPVDSEYVIDEPMKSKVATRMLKQIERDKRFYAACAAMQGFITALYGTNDAFMNLRGVSKDKDLADAEVIIKMSYEYADELIHQEHEQMEDKI